MSELQPLLTAVTYRLSNGSVARALYEIPEDQDDCDYVRKMIAEALTGRSTIPVDSIDAMSFIEAEILPQHIAAFLINPPT